MALPHTLVDLLNRAKVAGNERQEYERRIQSIFHKVYEKGRKVGYEAGYSLGLDDAFEVAREQSELIDEPGSTNGEGNDWAEGM